MGGSLLAVAEVGGTQAQGTVCVWGGGGQLKSIVCWQAWRLVTRRGSVM